VKRRAWKLVLGLLGGMVVIVGLIVGDAHRRASATFAHHDREVAAMIAALRSRDASRPSIFPDAVNENGWGPYQEAFAAFSALSEEEQQAFPRIGLFEEGELPDDHLLHNILAKYRPHLMLLEKGARCRIIEPGYNYEAGAEMALDWLTGALRAAQVLHGAAGHHYRTGDGAEALRLTALGLAVAQDLARKGPIICALIQFSGENLACDGLREILSSGHPFTATELDGFLAQLDLLDAHRPSLIDAWVGEEAYVRQSLLNPDYGRQSAKYFPRVDMRPGWRYVFSYRIMQAQALNVDAHVMDRARRLESLALKAKIAETDLLYDEAKVHPNPLVSSFMPSILRVFESDRVALLNRTMLRVAVSVARFQLDHGRDPDRLDELVPRYLPKLPDCPLTGTALHYRGGRFWSIGVNRVDDGGTPGSTNDAGDVDGDVVWTVRRK